MIAQAKSLAITLMSGALITPLFVLMIAMYAGQSLTLADIGFASMNGALFAMLVALLVNFLEVLYRLKIFAFFGFIAVCMVSVLLASICFNPANALIAPSMIYPIYVFGVLNGLILLSASILVNRLVMRVAAGATSGGLLHMLAMAAGFTNPMLSPFAVIAPVLLGVSISVLGYLSLSKFSKKPF